MHFVHVGSPYKQTLLFRGSRPSAIQFLIVSLSKRPTSTPLRGQILWTKPLFCDNTMQTSAIQNYLPGDKRRPRHPLHEHTALFIFQAARLLRLRKDASLPWSTFWRRAIFSMMNGRIKRYNVCQGTHTRFLPWTPLFYKQSYLSYQTFTHASCRGAC